MSKPDVADLIHYYRKQSGLSQLELARLAGVGKTVIYDLEKGKKSVRLNTLLKIFDVLNIQIKYVPPFSQTTDRDL